MNCANHPDRERKAFCQNCGKPLCSECARVVGQAVFCEPCLEARLAGANAGAPGGYAPFGTAPGNASARYEQVQGAAASSRPAGSVGANPYDLRGTVPPPPPGTPNPGIALLLGFIPGVGAMYNGQYAKGVIHLIVFAVLVSLADQNGIFGLFVAAWIFYQAFEAYHTARARRDGTPLPNPFGLNDLAERLGFGRSWPGASNNPGTAYAPAPPPPASVPPAQGGTSAPFSSAPQGVSGTGYEGVPTGSGAAAQANTYANSPYAADPNAYGSWGAPTDVYGGSSPAYVPAPPTSAGSNFPIGALVLIGLGLLFLLGSTRVLSGLPVHLLLPALLIGAGVWLFVQRMTKTGVGFADDGTPGYRLRLVRALQSSIWVVLTGVLFLLDNLNILSWGRSWPLFIIVGGVMAFLQRSAFSAVAAAQAPYVYPTTPVQAAAQAPPPPASTETSIVPSDREVL